MIEVIMSEQREDAKFISLESAGVELGVSRSSIYYYIKQLSLETKKFPLDRKTYISIADFECIKDAKKAADGGGRR